MPRNDEKAMRHVFGKRLHVVHVFSMHKSRLRIRSAFHVLRDLSDNRFMASGKCLSFEF